MKLVKICGNIWELTTLQSEEYAMSDNDDTTLERKNSQAIKGHGWHRGIVRVLANRGVKSRATAIIETEVNGLPQQINYDIYHNSKGFFCKVQKQRIFLIDLLENE